MEKLKVLNLYAGIGGNRKLLPDKEIEVTAVEIDPKIASIYQNLFPKDKVIVGDAHKYLLDHYKEFDFIWSSYPCQSHSDIRRMGVDVGQNKPIYPDMKLYEEIIFLKHFCKCLYVVENVKSYYIPLIKPYTCGRHYFWSNFIISNKSFEVGKIKRGTISDWEKITDITLHNIPVNKRTVYRNCVNPRLGLYIFNCAFKEK